MRGRGGEEEGMRGRGGEEEGMRGRVRREEAIYAISTSSSSAATHRVVEQLLQLLVGVVDAQLLEAVQLEDLEASYVEDADEAGALPLGPVQGPVDPGDDPLEEALAKTVLHIHKDSQASCLKLVGHQCSHREWSRQAYCLTWESQQASSHIHPDKRPV